MLHQTTWVAHKLNRIVAWDIMPKLKIFFPTIISHASFDKENPSKRLLNIDPLCPLCNVKTKDLGHMFRDCNVSQQVWTLASAIIG